MKYLLKVLLCLLFLFFALKFIIHVLDDGHTDTYNDGNFNIVENYTADDNNYQFNLKNNKFSLTFDVTADYNKASNIITKIHHKKINNYECVLPIFKDGKILTDIMCKQDKTVYYGADISNKITAFIKDMNEYGYKLENFQDKAKKTSLSATEVIYEDNILENHYLALENYKGLTLYNAEEMNVPLFDNDVYTKQVSVFTDKYYVVADYDTEYSFKIFKVVNIINGNEKEIRSYDEISFDSYIQGVVDNEIYLFDKDAKVQYKINIEDETVTKLDNIQYYDGSWHEMSLKDALDEKKFDNYKVQIDGYEKALKIGKYYYLYEKNGDNYNVYKAYNKKVKQRIFLFETSDINSIIYLQNYIYFKNGNTFYYWSNNGIKKVIENTELEFNNDLSFGAFIN